MKQFTKLLLLLLAILLPATAAGDEGSEITCDFEVDGIYYEILGGNQVAVTYLGIYEEEDDEWVNSIPSYSGIVTIPEIVTYEGTTYSVTSIGDYAFSNCSDLTSVTIPNSVTSIGDWAFYYCSNLTSVTIGNSVEEIGDGAFCGCSGLTNINIPNSVTYIGAWAFEGCSDLTMTIPNSVVSFGNGAFHGCSGLTGGVTINCDIGWETFAGCSGLTSVTIGSSVSHIDNSAFLECTALDTINFNAVSCADFEVTEIGDSPFEDLNISTINIGDDVQRIPAYFTRGWSSRLTSLTIPNSVTEIGVAAFSGCSVLTSIPNSVTEVGNYAFYGCSGLTSVNIPNAVTIGDWAFEDCSGLTYVNIGSSVTSIGEGVFNYCSALAVITVESGNKKYDSRNIATLSLKLLAIR